MSRADTVSVVIPAFNAEATLGSTIASVLDQTHREREVIVVDDGSTDGTADIIDRAARTDPRVVPVGDGTPTLRVTAMTIGGTAA